MITTPAVLVRDLKAQVLRLEDDLRTRVETQPEVRHAWQDEHRRAGAAERTAMSWQEWRDDRLTQAAVAWVLTTVFVRFCEDNALLRPVWISGPPERRQEALDAQNAYFRGHPTDTDREWLLQAVDHLVRTPATANLVDGHSMLWTVTPSGQEATALLDFWRERTPDGALARDFTDPELSTRFLGDLYQDLSDYAKKTYALLQTPEFVEEFILDHTLEPALAERPLDGFRMIDPACGSGHFLLGTFARLLGRWEQAAPGLEPRQRVQQALDAIHGVDLNPFAVAISRFRLTLAAMQASRAATLEGAPKFEYHVQAGDSLLHWHDQLDYGHGYAVGTFAHAYEDVTALAEILQPGRYDVVVGNPPYITVKDKGLNQMYRQLYPTCKGKYALTVPFMERFFELAKPRLGDRPAGWTGQITSNSFMKREFGSKLIEEFLTKQDLRLVVDTSGAYIPGHGTPTVILVGRRERPQSASLRAVLSVRGEPGRPEVPERGLVWSSIVENLNEPSYEDAWITVASLTRDKLARHPWSLSGGGADQLLGAVETARVHRLGDVAREIGITCVTGQDDFYLSSPEAGRVTSWPTMPLVEGDIVRDFSIGIPANAGWPYSSSFEVLPLDELGAFGQALRTYKRALDLRRRFGTPMVQRGLTWYEWQELYVSKLRTPLSITFAFVATHNHFVLDRGGKVFKQSAPVIKLPAGASEADHLGLLGVLNSSTACFWLKQNSHGKGNGGVNEGFRGDDWEEFFEFTGTTLKDFPLPGVLPRARATVLDRQAQVLAAASPGAISAAGIPSGVALAAARTEYDRIRGLMIAQQEELDWEVYRLYGLTDADFTYAGEPPAVTLGERAFEIVLARGMAEGTEDTAWFERHGSSPIMEIPAHWPADYRDLVQRRLEEIERNPSIRLLERPEYKRRWASESWEKQQEAALRGWLLDRLEDRSLWFSRQGHPTPLSIGQLADRVGRDADLPGVLALWEGRPDVPVETSLTRLLADEAVPYLAAYRLKDSGLRKREAWEHTWALQRQEDAGERVGTIPVPPKYTSADFRRASFWQARGKLDVPKERFIAYPDAGRATDPTPLIGWAGWDHAQQSLALATIIAAREAEGAADEVLVPLVAGMAELQPWVQQWHSEVDPAFGVSLAEYCGEELLRRAHQVGWSLEQLARWRPPTPTRGRRPRS